MKTAALTLAKVAVAMFCGLASLSAHAATYPERPIKIIVPYAAGGGADITARHIATHLGEALGQTVVVDPRPGGGTVIGTTAVARAEPDGYTLLLTGGSTMVLQPLTFEGELSFNPLADFEPIGMISRIPLFLAVAKSSPYNTLADLIAGAKANPGKISYAHNGAGGLAHLGTEIFANRAGIELVNVPYKSYTAAVPDFASGRVDLMMSDLNGLNTLMQNDSIRLLGVSSKERSPFHPEVPTFAESGFDGYEIEVWLALHAPKGTPDDIVARLSSELSTFLQTQEAKDALAKLGHVADSSGGAAVTQRIKTEHATFEPIVKAAGLNKGN